MKAMRIEAKRWPVLVGLMVMAALSVQPALAGTAEKMVFAVQNVRQDGTSNTRVRVVEVGRAASVGADPQVIGKTPTGPLADSIGIPSAAAPDEPFASEQQALDWVRTDIESHMTDGISSSLVALRQLAEDASANQGLFSYTRVVNVRNAAGGVEERRVGTTWTMTPTGEIKSDGYSISPSTVVALLYVRYSQAHVYKGLPEEWNLQDAGKVTWQLFQMDLSSSDSGFTPVGSPTIFDTGGTYDEPQWTWNADTNTADPPPPDMDGGVRKLAQWSQKHADGLNAKIILMDYGRTVQPVWKESEDGTLTAKLVVNVDQREVKISTCDEQTVDYINRGTYGAMLNTPRDYYFVTQGTPQKIGEAEKTSLSKSHAYTQKGRYRVPRGKIAYLKVLLAKIIVNPFAQTDQERVLYDYTEDPVNGLPEDHYVHIAGVTVDYERDSPYVFTGNVPGWGDVCADTRSGDFWINGTEQRWIPVYEENYSAYECPDRFNNESCGYTNHTVYTVDGSPTKNVCQAYDPLFPRVCTRSTVMYKTVVGHTSRMPNTTSISYSGHCWNDDTGRSCSTATIRNIIDGPLHGVFRENQRWSSRIKLSNNDLHYFLLNLDSITLKHNTYDGLQEIDPPGVIPETLTMRFINIPAPMFVPWEVTSERTLGRASLVTWSSDGKNSQTSQILQ